MHIGVLALQGGFAAHLTALREIGHDAFEIRHARDMDAAEGLVLPGGESTAILHLLSVDGGELLSRMHAAQKRGAPILATCAGLILIAREVMNPPVSSLGWLDVSVSRNAWGRQVASGAAVADDGHTSLVLIRAPRIVSCASHVEVLATLRGEPMLVRQGNVFGATFHPELDRDRRIHQLVFQSVAFRPISESAQGSGAMGSGGAAGPAMSDAATLRSSISTSEPRRIKS